MIQKHLYLLTLVLLACACEAPVPERVIPTWRLAPEYTPSEAVWLLWPNVDHRADMSNAAVTLQLIQQVLPVAQVYVVCATDSIRQSAAALLPDSILQNKRLHWKIHPFQEFWARDMGPIFVRNNFGRLGIADFNFNAWDYGNPATDATVRTDEQLDERIADSLKLPLISSNMVHESGDHEINGQGVLMAVEAVERQRNPNMSLPEMEAEFKRLLGAQQVIWLKEGLYEDESSFDGPITGADGERLYTLLTTNGHIDEFVRFVNDSTILLAEVADEDLASGDKIALENAKRLSVNEQILRQARQPNGRPFQLVRIPLPPLITGQMTAADPVYGILAGLSYRDGSVFPQGKPIEGIAAASYCNFLIINGLVIMPKYARAGWSEQFEERDRAAVKVLQTIFPNKKIIQLDALSVNYGGGGIHCITMQQQ
jgi:agmatine deiminase